MAYVDRLLGWMLGQGHPTDPVRARLSVEALRELAVPMDVQPITWQLTDELEVVHTKVVPAPHAGPGSQQRVGRIAAGPPTELE